jgi:ferredoxin
MIRFEVQHSRGDRKVIEVPEEINLNLMEVLRASDYPIAATCGGMALCATCQVEVLEGGEQLSEPGSAELDMLDTLPDATAHSRLACQIKINGQLQDVVLRLKSLDS